MSVAPLEQEKHETGGGNGQPSPAPALARPHADGISAPDWRQPAKCTRQPEVWRAQLGEIGEAPPRMRRRPDARHENVSVAPQARRAAPPPAEPHVTDEVGSQHARE